MLQQVAAAGNLRPDWFNERLGPDVLGDARVADVTVEPITRGVMTRMVRARLTYDRETDAPASVIVKFPTEDPGSLGVAQAMGLYPREVGFYRDIAPLLPELHVPRCYHGELDDSGMFTLVLEDLSEVTRPGDVLVESSIDDCHAGLGELVALQAPLWNAPKLREVPYLADRDHTAGIFDQAALGLKPFVERFGDKLQSEHVELFEQYLPKAGDWVRSWSPPTVVQHGDFRPDNILFGTAPGTAAATVVDFQTVRSGPPGVDLAYFIGSSLSIESRRKHERDLVAEYHRRLLAAGVEGFDFDACWESYRAGAMYGVFLFVGMAGSVESSERADRLIADQIGRYATMALDLEAPQAARLAS